MDTKIKSDPRRAKLNKYPFIDSIRGIAFLGVMICHITPMLERLGTPAILTRFGSQGGVGVQLSFIASALTLMLSLDARSSTDQNPIRNFFLRRFFRIAPLFYVGVLFYGVLWPLAFEPKEYYILIPITWQSILSTLTFTNCWVPQWINRVVPGGWSISVEMMFYLMVPFLHAKLKGWRQSALLTIFLYVVGIAMSNVTLSWLGSYQPSLVPEMDEWFVHFWFPRQLYRFFAGFTLYFLIREDLKNQGGQPARPADFLKSSALFFLSLLIFAISMFGPVPRSLSALAATASLVCFFWSLAIAPTLIFVNAVTRLIGKLSFSAYLSHFAVYKYLESTFERLGLFDHSYSWMITGCVFVLGTLVLTLIISEILYRFIEKPGISLGRWMITRLDSPAELERTTRVLETHSIPKQNESSVS